MNFYDWMMVKYLGKSTPRGNLANDMKHVGDFPKDGDRKEIIEHLRAKNACEECLTVFKRCWQSYRKESDL